MTLTVPSSASLVTGFQPVVFDYAALGRYTVSYDANTQALAIALAQSTTPGDWLWPLDGENGVDWVINNYVDLDPGFGILDYGGGSRSYDGHLGVDADISTFRDQDAGVAVRAAVGGRVVNWFDDNPDRNTSCAGSWNFVQIRTPEGSNVYYGHLKTDSVLVTTDQVVEAGAVLGMVGSSGCSTQPHLHLEAFDRFGALIDPFHDGLFADPPSYEVPLSIMDVIVNADPDSSLLDPPPNVTSLSAPWQLVSAASLGGGFGGQTFGVRLIRPNGTTVDTVTFPEYTTQAGHSFWGHVWDLSEDHGAGTWRIEFLINGDVERSHDVQVLP